MAKKKSVDIADMSPDQLNGFRELLLSRGEPVEGRVPRWLRPGGPRGLPPACRAA